MEFDSRVLRSFWNCSDHHQRSIRRVYHATTLVDSFLFVLGGITNDDGHENRTNSFVKYHLDSGEYYVLSISLSLSRRHVRKQLKAGHSIAIADDGSAPETRIPALCHHSLTLVEQRNGQKYLYAFGGQLDDPARTPSRRLFRFDVERDRWKEIISPPGIGPPPVYSHTATVVDSSSPRASGAEGSRTSSPRIFIFGGTDGSSFFGSLFVLETDRHRWMEIDTGASSISPVPRSGHSCVSYGSSELYVFGGGNDDQILNDTFVFNVDRQEWSDVRTQGVAKPTQRTQHAASVVGNQMIVVGGVGVNEIVCLDLDEKTWNIHKFEGSKEIDASASASASRRGGAHPHKKDKKKGGRKSRGSRRGSKSHSAKSAPSTPLSATSPHDSYYGCIDQTQVSPSALYGHGAVARGSTVWIVGGKSNIEDVEERAAIGELYTLDTGIVVKKPIEIGRSSLLDDLSGLVNDRTTSDVILDSRGIHFYCHKAVFRVRCPVLNRECIRNTLIDDTLVLDDVVKHLLGRSRSSRRGRGGKKANADACGVLLEKFRAARKMRQKKKKLKLRLGGVGLGSGSATTPTSLRFSDLSLVLKEEILVDEVGEEEGELFRDDDLRLGQPKEMEGIIEMEMDEELDFLNEKSLLHVLRFIYTDDVPGLDVLDEELICQIGHLAKLFQLERLYLLCLSCIPNQELVGTVSVLPMKIYDDMKKLYRIALSYVSAREEEQAEAARLQEERMSQSSSPVSGDEISFGSGIPSSGDEAARSDVSSASGSSSFMTASSLSSGFSVFQTAEYAFCDVLVKVEGETIGAHKCVLVARPTELRKLVTASEFKGTLEVVDVRALIFKILLEFLYTDRATITFGVALECLVAAEEYGVERLSRLCQSVIEKRVHAHNVCRIYAIADSYNILHLRDSCEIFIIRHMRQVTKSGGWKGLSRDTKFALRRKRKEFRLQQQRERDEFDDPISPKEPEESARHFNLHFNQRKYIKRRRSMKKKKGRRRQEKARRRAGAGARVKGKKKRIKRQQTPPASSSDSVDLLGGDWSSSQ